MNACLHDRREGKFGIENHVSSKRMKSKIFLILIWSTLKWKSRVLFYQYFRISLWKPKKPFLQRRKGRDWAFKFGG